MRVAVFFTLGNSLDTWRQAGILDRELAIYRRLADRGIRILLVTYGGGNEAALLKGERGIRAVGNGMRLPARLYQRMLPLLHARELRRCDVFKTNQTNGAQVALKAAQLLGRPLIARCGYMWSRFAAEQYGPESPEFRTAERIEREVFSRADVVVTTTEAMREDALGRVGIDRSKCRVIPNYVDTDLFRPMPGRRDAGRIVFVGRLARQKNVEALLDAAAALGMKVTVVGAGPDRNQLMDRYADCGTEIRWIERVPHAELPAVLNTAAMFVLPSLYEGHPKALIEAMACGLPVIGANSPGIREIIADGENGLLCDATREGVSRALTRLSGSPAERDRLGAAARRFAETNFSLDSVVEAERQTIEALAGRPGCS